MKLVNNIPIVLLIILTILTSLSIQLKSSLRMKTKLKKFYSKAHNSFLLDLWKAPGSPKTVPAFVDSNVDSGFSPEFAFSAGVQDFRVVGIPAGGEVLSLVVRLCDLARRRHVLSPWTGGAFQGSVR